MSAVIVSQLSIDYEFSSCFSAFEGLKLEFGSVIMNSTLVQAFDDLSKKNVLGNYDQFEIIEVIGFQNKTSTPTNIFTLLVATEGSSNELPVGFINGKERITLKGLPNWTFGVHRRWLSLEQARGCLEQFNSTHMWEVESGKSVLHGPLSHKPVQFVPANSSGKIPLNRVLKNNFWAGSHILELGDTTKSKLNDLLHSPKHLLQLSEEIQKFIPLEIGALSDRLGNVVFQFPVEALRCQFFKSKDNNSLSVEVAWHPSITERRLIAQMEIIDDQAIASFGTVEVSQSGVHLIMPDPGYGSFRGTLWDVENNILLAATDQMSVIREIHLNSGMISPEPRIFRHKGVEHRVKIQTNKHLSVFEDEDQPKSHKQTWSRLYSEEKIALEDRKELIQYKAPFSTTAHDDAMQDIRWLIQKHGQYGAWLWDPYLSADDIIGTLFFSPHGHSDMRALTGLNKVPHDSKTTRNVMRKSRSHKLNTGNALGRKKMNLMRSRKTTATKTNLVNLFAQALETSAADNCSAMSLKVRKSANKNFHDRFLIFPRPTEEPLVWSLGTSVNSMGTSHHILQMVQNGRLVFDAFEALWDASAAPKHLIWSS